MSMAETYWGITTPASLLAALISLSFLRSAAAVLDFPGSLQDLLVLLPSPASALRLGAPLRAERMRIPSFASGKELICEKTS